jgi:hypothetical protein
MGLLLPEGGPKPRRQRPPPCPLPRNLSPEFIGAQLGEKVWLEYDH